MSSYRLSFFEKLIICRGLKFSLTQKVSSIDHDGQASFEKAYWRIEPLLEENDKELVSSASGSGVVVTDKADYIRLLSAASVDNISKFIDVDDKRPKSRGRPPKKIPPAPSEREKFAACTSLPKTLPKTHKATLSIRPI